MRTRKCDLAVRTARMRKATRFFDDASLLQELSDDPSQADSYVSLLERADSGAGKHLQVLLGMKSKAGYSALSPSADEGKRAGRAAETLVERARLLHQAA